MAVLNSDVINTAPLQGIKMEDRVGDARLLNLQTRAKDVRSPGDVDAKEDHVYLSVCYALYYYSWVFDHLQRYRGLGHG